MASDSIVLKPYFTSITPALRSRFSALHVSKRSTISSTITAATAGQRQTGHPYPRQTQVAAPALTVSTPRNQSSIFAITAVKHCQLGPLTVQALGSLPFSHGG